MFVGMAPIKVARVRTQAMKHGMRRLSEFSFLTGSMATNLGGTGFRMLSLQSGSQLSATGAEAVFSPSPSMKQPWCQLEGTDVFLYLGPY